MRRFAVSIALVAAGLPSRAQEAQTSVVRLSLSEALQRSREHSAHLRSLGARQEAAAASLRGARAERLPQLDLYAAYARHSNVPELVITAPGLGTRTVFPNIPDVYRTRAQVTLPLWTGGRVAGGIDSASHARDAAARDLEAGRSDLILDVAIGYWDLVTAREALRVLREALGAYESHLADARNRKEVGMAANNEVLAVQVDRDRAELQRLVAERAARIANAGLLRLTGLPEGSVIEPTEGLEPAGTEPEEALATLVSEALAARPDLAALRARALSLESSARIAQAATRPQVSAQAGYDYASPNMRVLPMTDAWKGTWSVELEMSLTPWDGGRTAAAAAVTRAEAEALRHELEEAERSARLEVEARLLDLRTAEATSTVAERNRMAADENVRVTRDRYREGLALSSELLDAESQLLRAGLDQTQAGTQRRLARARLDRALGR